jgi:hypothetical protein
LVHGRTMPGVWPAVKASFGMRDLRPNHD